MTKDINGAKAMKVRINSEAKKNEKIPGNLQTLVTRKRKRRAKK